MTTRVLKKKIKPSNEMTDSETSQVEIDLDSHDKQIQRSTLSK